MMATPMVLHIISHGETVKSINGRHQRNNANARSAPGHSQRCSPRATNTAHAMTSWIL
jgi:hypothetical protein